MATLKFSSDDRRLVIRSVEKELGVKLERIGSRKKYLRDASGRRYCVVGGYGDWHGLPGEIVAQELKYLTDSLLVVAKRLPEQIDIYTASLRLLIEGRARLTCTKKGQYVFNLQASPNRLVVKELPHVVLRKLGSTVAKKTDSKPGSETNTERIVAEMEAILSRLAPEERSEVLETMTRRFG